MSFSYNIFFKSIYMEDSNLITDCTFVILYPDVNSLI